MDNRYKKGERCEKIYTDIIVVNVIVIIISVIIWFKYRDPIGILLISVTMWTSYMYIKIADRQISWPSNKDTKKTLKRW